MRSRFALAAALALLAAVPACSLILDKSENQCSTDGDCAKFAGTTCIDRACVVGTGLGSGGASGSGGSGGAAPACSVPLPMTNDELLNYPCTNASCLPFDNCARIGICNGASLPPLVTPPTGGVP